MEQVLRYWESLDGGSWDDATRLECSGFIESQPFSVEEWKAYLIPVPADVHTRYEKVTALLLNKHLIDEATFQAEREAMKFLSPATMARNGKILADWYRNTV